MLNIKNIFSLCGDTFNLGETLRHRAGRENYLPYFFLSRVKWVAILMVVLYSQYSIAETHFRDTVFLNGEKAGARAEFKINTPSEANIVVADALSIAAVFTAPTENINQSGELYLVAIHDGIAWMKTAASNWVVWDRQIASLTPVQVFKKQPENIPISIVDGLQGLPGHFSLYIGFSNASGQFLFTSSPVKFSIKQDFSKAEENEALLGGSATSFTFTEDAFSRPSANLGIVSAISDKLN